MYKTSILCAIICSSFFLISYLSYVKGLECYECAHAKIGDVNDDVIERIFETVDISVDDSCKAGKKPKDTYVKTCSDVPKNGSVSCMKLSVDENILGGVKLTLRGCFPLDIATNTTCSTKRLTELFAMYPADPDIRSPVQNALSLALPYIGGDLEIDPKSETCFCDSTECNTSTSTYPMHVSLMATFGFISYAIFR